MHCTGTGEKIFLKFIGLSSNDISDEGARCLSDALETNGLLTKIALSRSKILHGKRLFW